MENPTVTAAFAITSGDLSVNGGRPPDPVFTLDGTSGFAHPRSPTGFNAQQSYKKGRGVDGSCDSQKDLDVMMRDDSSDTIVELDNSDPSLALSPTAKAVDGGIFSPGVPSFKEKLMGAAGCIRDTVNLSVLDVDVRDEDVRIGVPTKVTEDIEASACRDPNALYGPWMQVIDRRRKVGMQKKVMGRMGSSNSGKLVHGSRFGVLMEDVDHVERQDTVIREQRFKGLSSAEGNRGSVSSRGVPEFDGGHTVPENVASAGRVIAAKSSLTAAKNVTVQVLEPGMALGSHASKGRILPNSLRSGLSKSNLNFKQLGTKQKKRDGRGVGKQSIASGLSKLMEDLNNAETSVAFKQGSIASGGNGDEKRGALDPTLIRSFKLLVRKQKDWQLVFRYVPRSLNRLADRLAALGRLSSREGITLPVPPTDLVSLVEEESESADPALLVAHNWGSAESVVYFNINV
ncbi:hypothetical protein V6N13_073767 [Hibiscus sabdariffa]